MTTTLARARALIEAAEKATPAPWTYRRLPSDDWGMVRAPTASERYPALVAMARTRETLTHEQAAEHRRNGTDPYGHNATFIAAARNDSPDIARALVEAVEIARTVAALDGRYLSVAANLAIESARAWLAKHGEET